MASSLAQNFWLRHKRAVSKHASHKIRSDMSRRFNERRKMGDGRQLLFTRPTISLAISFHFVLNGAQSGLLYFICHALF